MKRTDRSTDVAIIGGGPAGISAALWCDELGMDAVLIEQDDQLGGQLKHIYNPIENYPGRTAQNGVEMIQEFEKTVRSRNFVRTLGIKVDAIDPGAMCVHLGSGQETLSCRAIVIATGVRRRVLRIPGETEFRGKGILESGARDKASVKGKKVLIVGGGDAAFENALILSEFASSISVAFRKPEPSARPEFVESVARSEKVRLLPSTVVSKISGNRSVEAVELTDQSGDTRIETVDSVLIRIGVVPNSELVRDLVEVDGSAYITVDQTGLTTTEGIYAVGDVANPCAPTLSTAVGTGATAAKAIFRSIKNAKAL